MSETRRTRDLGHAPQSVGDLRSQILSCPDVIAPAHGRDVTDSLIEQVSLLHGAYAESNPDAGGIAITTGWQNWTYALHVAFADLASVVAAEETIVVRFVLAVDSGAVEIFEVDEGGSMLQGPCHLLRHDPFPQAVTFRIEHPGYTRGLMLRNVSCTDCPARLTVYGLSAFAMADDSGAIGNVIRSEAELRSALVLIHTLGKTASQALEASLRVICRTMHIRRDHFVSDTYITTFEHTNARIENFQRSWTFQAAHATASAEYLKLYAAQNRPIFVVSGFRDPFSRLIANVMQHLELYIGFTPQSYPDLLPELTALVVAFCRQLLSHPDGFREPDIALARGEEWWRHEMHAVHGLPADAATWRRDGLLWRADTSDRTVILYRMEDAPESLNQVIRRVSGSDQASCARYNAAADKPYAELYEAVMRAARFSADAVESVLGWDYVRLLYDAEDRDEMRARWTE